MRLGKERYLSDTDLIEVDDIIGRSFMITRPGPNVRDIKRGGLSIMEQTCRHSPDKEEHGRRTDHETGVHGSEAVGPFDGMHIRK